MMNSTFSFKNLASIEGHFLVASPRLNGTLLEQKLILMTSKHPRLKALNGLILNAPLPNIQDELRLFDDLHLEIKNQHKFIRRPVYKGELKKTIPSVFVLHNNTNDNRFIATSKINDEVCITTSLDCLKKIAAEQDLLDDYKIYVGMSSWTIEQLEDLIKFGYLFPVPFNYDLCFRVPAEHQYRQAISYLSYNIETIDLGPLPEQDKKIRTYIGAESNKDFLQKIFKM